MTKTLYGIMTCAFWTSFAVMVAISARNMWRAFRKACLPREFDPLKPARYRLKPVYTVAVRYMGQPVEGVCQKVNCPGQAYLYGEAHIHHIERSLTPVMKGNWVIKGVGGDRDGKTWVVDDRCFRSNYEPDE